VEDFARKVGKWVVEEAKRMSANVINRELGIRLGTLRSYQQSQG
jgi:hypothetical protein